MQFVKFNYRFFNLKVWWCHFEGKCNTQHFNEFFWQNREKLKYRFLTFLPVTWVKIELQKGTIHQMNGWNLYFLVDFYAIVENSTWGALGPRMLLSNSSNHPLFHQKFFDENFCAGNFLLEIFCQIYWFFLEEYFWPIIF